MTIPMPTEADVEFYQDNGYWIGPKIFSDEELALFREHHARVVAGNYDTERPPFSRSVEPGEPLDRIVKIDNSYWCDAVLARLVVNPVIGEMAARLSRSSTIRLWHDQLLFKPTQSGAAGAVGWHQDHFYWQCCQPGEMITAWVALVDVDENNGCMEVVPGSHKWGLLPEGNFFDHDLESLREKIQAASGKPFDTVSCKLPAGTLSFHHCRTVHGSHPNLSDGPRISMVVHMMPEGTHYKSDTTGEGHGNVRLLSGKDGDLYVGPYFPVLYREGETGANPWHLAQ